MKADSRCHGNGFRLRFDETALLSETSIPCLMRIAENPSVPPSMLEHLAMHPDARVREAVADNPNTPLDTLWLLVYDSCADVRYAMSENHNLPLSLLTALAEDENPYVASRARQTIYRIGSLGQLLHGYFRNDRGSESASC
jgi:hypothetical protein